MKQLFLICTLCGVGWQPLPAQSIATMTEQLAALRQLSRTIEDGYQLVGHGLKGIGEIRQSEFELHSDYFGSLAVVNPELTEDTKVLALQQLQTQLITLLTNRLAYWHKQPPVQ